MTMKMTEAASCLLQIAAGREVRPEQLHGLANLFSGSGSQIETAGFIELSRRVQQDLYQLPAARDLVANYKSRLGQTAFPDDSLAQQFIHQFVEAFGSAILWLRPITIGLARRRRGTLFDIVADQSTGIPGWLLLYTEEGTGVLDTGIRKIQMPPGSAALFEPGAVFSYYREAESEIWSHYWIGFQAEAKWRDWLGWPRVGPHIGYLELVPERRPDILNTLEQLNESFLSNTPMNRELDHNLLEQLILRCRNLLPQETEAGTDPRVSKAQVYIEMHYNQKFTLDDVAAAANLSASRMAHMFKAETGLSIMAWRDEKRMMAAAQMLRSSRASIADIAAEVGFIDAPFFSRTFKRLIGCTPREYRSRT